jgi:release factor glutamine methyltransferase
MDANRPATPLERQTLRDLVARALKHEPVQYLVGEAWFFGLPFHVDPRVLIPRPSTETIVEQVLLHARAEPGFGGKAGDGLLFADLCTGTGCIAITLLKNLPAARAIATDIAGAALEVARKNADRHGVADRLDFLQGDLTAPLLDHPAAMGGGALHYILANPPYIPDHEWSTVAPNVKEHEPHNALRAPPDGLTFVRPIIESGPRFLRPGGLLLVEIASCTAPVVLDLAKSSPDLENARIEPDFEGLPRVLIARRNTKS